MWNYLPASSPEFRGVSEAGGCHPVEFETDSRVDDIQLEHVTGEGRFGEVRARAWGTTHSGGARARAVNLGVTGGDCATIGDRATVRGWETERL